ncbi:MAG: L,D-transpeptidase family protein [Gammaproteobacteria bacterium]|nr:L,D-transpeptidase family protein [Gammaproteobacteria bacterium]
MRKASTLLRSMRLATAGLLVVPGMLSAEVFLLSAGDDVIGATGEVTAVYEDTLVDLGRRHGVGYEEMVRANPGVDVWLPGEGTAVNLPTRFVLPDTPRRGVVINIAEYRLYYYDAGAPDGRVSTFPISIGKMDWSTPLGRAAITAKSKNPAWYPPQSVREEYAADGRILPRVVPPGPDNPLGNYAMRLSVPGYLIHGTNRPAGVGMRVTHGCIRMYPEDIDWLFPQVSVNTPVYLVNQPYKIGWQGDALMLEVHRPLEEDENNNNRGLTIITELYVRATRARPAEVDWSQVELAYNQGSGIPVRIGTALPLPEPQPELDAAEQPAVASVESVR